MNDIPSLIERLDAWNGRADHEGCVHHVPIELLVDARNELSRLTVSPLPGEIARLIWRLENPLWVHDFTDRESPQLATDETRADMEAAAAALQRLAEEVERLEEIITARDQQLTAEIALSSKFCRQYDEGVSRIAELEAEVERLKAEQESNPYIPLAGLQARIAELEAERDALQQDLDLKGDCYAHDAIRAKTREECAAAAVNACIGPPSTWENGKPKNWRLDRPCTVLEAGHHDAGCISAAKAIRALNQPEAGGGE